MLVIEMVLHLKEVYLLKPFFKVGGLQKLIFNFIST